MTKYPRTLHLPYSNSIARDDKIQYDLSEFNDKHVIITEKMDGENTTMTSSNIYARSPDSIDHPSRHYVKGIWGNIKHLIPKGYRICGENVYVKHSINYTDLQDYFLVFSLWFNEVCFSWDTTVEMSNNLGLHVVPVLYNGIYNEDVVKGILTTLDTTKQEGIVMRVAGAFNKESFEKCVVKWVRSNHVQDDIHWINKPIIKNKLQHDT
jgi:ATP-dependent RNA circularization protein (DNA/RNA ligase family)